MKGFIKQVMKREGKKSQVKIGDMRELKKLEGKLFISPFEKDRKLVRQLERYFEKMHFKRYGIRVVFDFAPKYFQVWDRRAVKRAHAQQLRAKKKQGM